MLENREQSFAQAKMQHLKRLLIYLNNTSLNVLYESKRHAG